jgi:hypothetical protein
MDLFFNKNNRIFAQIMLYEDKLKLQLESLNTGNLPHTSIDITQRRYNETIDDLKKLLLDLQTPVFSSKITMLT